MTVFVVDASHYQAGLPVTDLPRQGFAALILKATQGSGWVDAAFERLLAEGRSAGLFLAAYHFLEPGSDAYVRAQAVHCAAVVPADVPVWVDVEKQGATRAEAYVFAEALRAAGRRLGGIYCGSQPAAGYGGWWRAAYLTDPTAFASVAYQQLGGDAGPGWAAGAGRHPDLWQFCDHGRVSGYSGDVDFSAYRGTPEELRVNSWFWSPPPPVPPPAPHPVPQPAPQPQPAAAGSVTMGDDDMVYVVDNAAFVAGGDTTSDGRRKLYRVAGGAADGTGRYHDYVDAGVAIVTVTAERLAQLGFAVQGIDF